MKAEKMFFKVIKGVLSGNEINFSDFSDYDRLYRLFKEHNLLIFLYTAIKDKAVPEYIKEQAKNEYNLLVLTQTNQDYYADRIFNELNDNNIEYAPLKGRTIRELYPFPFLRVSCDVDFLYKKEHDKRVKEIITKLGGKYTSSYLNDDTFVFDGFVSVEAHHSLMATDEDMNDYFSSVWDVLLKVEGKNSEYCFPKNYLYSYYIAHAHKHFFKGGFGVRTLIDVYLLQGKIDREETDKVFKKLSISVFEKKISDLSVKLFSSENGFEKLSEEEKDILDYILNGGAYGKPYNSMVIKNADKTGKKTKFKYYLRRIFVPYKQMAKQYRILKYLPILLPFMWVYRLLVAVLFKNGKVRAEIKTANRIDDNSVDRVNKVLEYFKEKNI